MSSTSLLISIGIMAFFHFFAVAKYVGLSRQKFVDDPCAVKIFDLAVI